MTLLVSVVVASLVGIAITMRPGASILMVAACGVGLLVLAFPPMSLVVEVVLLSIPTSGWGATFGAGLQIRTFVCLAIGALGAVAAARFQFPKTLNGRLLIVVALIVIFIGYQAAASDQYRSQIAARLLMIGIALSVAAAIWMSHRSQPNAVAASVTLAVVFLSLEAALGIAQFATSRLLLMGEALPPASIAEATNIPGFVRGIGTYYHANALALALVLGLIMALASFTFENQVHRRVALAAMPVMTLGIVATLSRAGLAALAIVSIGYLLLRVGRAREAVVVALVVLVTLAAFFLIPGLQSAAGRFDPTATGNRDAGANAARIANLTGAIHAIEEKPWTGWGFGTSSQIDVGFGGYTNLGAGNEYLEVLQGGGLILGVLMVALVMALVPAFRRALVLRSPLALYAIVLPLYALVESILQGVFLVLLVAGITLAAIVGQAPNGQSTPRNN